LPQRSAQMQRSKWRWIEWAADRPDQELRRSRMLMRQLRLALCAVYCGKAQRVDAAVDAGM
jgi:hypothetical protein